MGNTQRRGGVNKLSNLLIFVYMYVCLPMCDSQIQNGSAVTTRNHLLLAELLKMRKSNKQCKRQR